MYQRFFIDCGIYFPKSLEFLTACAHCDLFKVQRPFPFPGVFVAFPPGNKLVEEDQTTSTAWRVTRRVWTLTLFCNPCLDENLRKTIFTEAFLPKPIAAVFVLQKGKQSSSSGTGNFLFTVFSWSSIIFKPIFLRDEKIDRMVNMKQGSRAEDK